MSSNQRGRLRALGVLGAAMLAGGIVVAPASAQEVGVVLDVTATESVEGAPGDTLMIETSVTNTGDAALEGGIVDFEVPEGATVIGVTDQELEEGERPEEGCALVSPQRVECHTEGTLEAGASNEATFEVQLNEDAPAGELGVATLLVEGDNGGSATAETTITVQEDGPALEVSATESVEGAPGDVVVVDTTVTNNGAAALEGGNVDFEVPEGATIVGIVDGEIVDGTERPEEGCALVTPQRLECHTAAVLEAGASNEASIEVQLNEDAPAGELGVATLLVEGDNGGSGTAETTITVTGGEVVLDVTATESVEGAAGDTLMIETSVTNTGDAALEGGIVDFEVPEGATVVGVGGQELEEGERPEEGCALVSPQRVECHTEGTLEAGASNEATFEVQLNEDAPAGELGVATVLVEGDNGGSDTAETTITVVGDGTETGDDAGDEGSETGSDDGAETGDEDGDELPDTGAGTWTALLAGIGLLAVGGAVLALRGRRTGVTI